MFIYMYFSWTTNHYAIKAIKHDIKSSFRGSYHHYDAMTEELPWRTSLHVENYYLINNTGFMFYVFQFSVFNKN